MENLKQHESSLPLFYKDAVILITGGTGFLGKCLVEKLLRSFPQIRMIYMIVRPKNGQSSQQRVQDYINDSIFLRLRAEDPDQLCKVKAINGDCSLPKLGLSADDERRLIDEIQIVFHAAATVKFTEPLAAAVAINVRGTLSILELCRSMMKLKAFVHVSTAYSNCPQTVIKEAIYIPPMEYEKIFKLVDVLDETTLNTITPILLGDWPNTYTYTKCIAESIVEKESKGLPVGIFRPAVIIPTYDEPTPCWTDNYAGMTGVIVSAAKGYLRVLNGGNTYANMVPVDLCSNHLIAIAWDISQRHKEQQRSYDSGCCNSTTMEVYMASKIPVYNFVGEEALITWSDLGKMCKLGLHQPFDDAIWYYCVTLIPNTTVYNFVKFFVHTLPAAVVDGVQLFLGNTPKALKSYKKIHHLTRVLEFFTKRNFNFHTENVKNLWLKLNEFEKSLIPFSMLKFNWERYGREFLPGVQKHLMNQVPKNLKQAQIRYRRLYYLHMIVKSFPLFLICITILKFSYILKTK